MKSQDIKKILRNFLREYKIDQKEFAGMIGKSEVTISRWLNNDKPLSESNINAIRFIIWSHSGKLVEAEAEKMRGDARFLTPGELVPVPLLSSEQAGKLPYSAPQNETPPHRENVYFERAAPGDFAMVVTGESMLPWYPPGTRILVGRGRTPQSGDRVVASLTGYAEPLFKLYLDNGGSFTLRSLNRKDGSAPLTIDKMDRDSWNWVWPVRASIRDEEEIDKALQVCGLNPFLENPLP